MLTIKDFGMGGTKNNSASTNSNEWRLPTIQEFKNVLYPNKDMIPNLEKDGLYWSSSDSTNNSKDLSFLFYSGLTGNGVKNYPGYVRPVRNVSSNSTNSANSTIIGNLEVWNEDLGIMDWYYAMEAVDAFNKNNKYETGGNMDYYSKYAKKGFSATKKIVKKHTKKAIKTVKSKSKIGFGKAKSYLKSKI